MVTTSFHHNRREAYQVEGWRQSNNGRRFRDEEKPAQRKDDSSAEKRRSELEFYADLGGEGNADGGAGAEEIAEGAGGNEQLLATRDRHGARWIRTKRRDVREVVHGYGQRADIANVVVARIVAIEEVEEFDEGRERPALVELDRAAHTQIRLKIWRAAELVESRLHTVDHRAIAGRSGQRDRPRCLRLREKRHIETSRSINGSGENEAMPDVFSRWTIVSRSEGV